MSLLLRVLLNKEVEASPPRLSTAFAAAVLPILVVLYKFCKQDLTARQIVKRLVASPVRVVNVDGDPSHAVALHSSLPSPPSSPPPSSPVQPSAPSDLSIEQRVMALMTSLDSEIKRCAAELLYVLCDEDGKG